MKRHNILILCSLMLALLLIVAGCGDDGTDASSEPHLESVDATTTPEASAESSEASIFLETSEESAESVTSSEASEESTVSDGSEPPALSGDAKEIVGTWETEWNIDQFLISCVEMAGDTSIRFYEAVFGDVLLKASYTFRADGTYALSIDVAALEKEKDSLCRGMTNYYEGLIKEMGFDGTLEELLSAQGVDSVGTMVDGMISEFARITEDGGLPCTWAIKDGMFCMDNHAPFAYELASNELTLFNNRWTVEVSPVLLKRVG